MDGERFARRRQRRNSIIGKICYEKQNRRGEGYRRTLSAEQQTNEKYAGKKKNIIKYCFCRSETSIHSLSLYENAGKSLKSKPEEEKRHIKGKILSYEFSVSILCFPLLAHIISLESSNGEMSRANEKKKRVKSGKNEQQQRRWMRMYNFLSYFLLLLMCSMKLFHFVRAQPPLCRGRSIVDVIKTSSCFRCCFSS